MLKTNKISVFLLICAVIAVSVPAIASQKIEARVFELVNNYRRENGLNELTVDERISNVARQHSINMAEGKAPFSHQGWKGRFDFIRKRVGGLRFAENVGYNEGYNYPADKAVKDWLASEEHLKNIMGDYNLTGIGAAKVPGGVWYFTQIFVR